MYLLHVQHVSIVNSCVIEWKLNACTLGVLMLPFKKKYNIQVTLCSHINKCVIRMYCRAGIFHMDFIFGN